MLQSGKVVALAVTGPDRVAGHDSVATFIEQGYAIPAVGWNGLFCHAGTPKPIADRLSAAARDWAKSPEGRARLTALSLVPTGTTSEEFAELLRKDMEVWAEVVRKSGVKLS